MIALTYGDCPCLHAERSPTDGRIITRPAPDCSACDGSGTARFLTSTAARNVVRVDPAGVSS